MKIKSIIVSLIATISIYSCTSTNEEFQITPKPNSLEYLGGKSEIKWDCASAILSVTDSSICEEGYRLNIKDGKVKIEASSDEGFFYAQQTLNQIRESFSKNGKGNSIKIPNVIIEDAPAYKWRGMHLDVSRHFYDVEFIKKQLDAMARYKMNRFHWHLTDGTGWRLEIPDYPRLTEFGAWRPMHSWKEWWNGKGGRGYCEKGTEGAYGGYYTKEDVLEIIEYAKLRHITIIPEIEFPGHSEEVIASYPELGCKKTKSSNYSSEFCVGNPLTYKFIDDVLSYVIELFPSPYIHIGGDEVNKSNWENCPRCQALMRKEGMKEEGELQDYIIKYIEKFIISHGKTMVGWDEIYKKQLDHNSVVMSWRGTKIGYEAAEHGNQVVMCPGQFCYFDKYQADPETQPEAIGGYLVLEEVYSYNPEPKSNILGIQACVWAEYLFSYEHTEYMIYPRLLAIAETGWTVAENKNWEDFRQRANTEISRLKALGYNPYTLSPTPFVNQKIKNGEMLVELSSERYPAQIRYTTDGSEVSKSSKLYKEAIVVKDSLILKAAIFNEKNECFENEKVEYISKRFDKHKAFGKTVSYEKRIYPDYKAGGDTALTDGLRGGKGYGDGRWQGFCPNDMIIVIDLGEATEFHSVQANFMQVVGPYIFLPIKVEVFSSDNGSDFTLLGTQENNIPQDAEGVIFKDFGWKGAPTTARYIKMHAHQNKILGFLFTDEVVVL